MHNLIYGLTTELPVGKAPCFKSLEQDSFVMFMLWVLRSVPEMETEMCAPPSPAKPFQV
jgi:hypothetical protein